MDRRAACVSLAALSASAVMPVRAQSGRRARVAWTSVDRANPDSLFFASFRRAMRDAGWTEGRNVAIDAFWGGGSVDGLKKIVPEVLASKPDVVVAAGGPATRAMIDTGMPLPVVFTSSADPVIGKIVNGWARPGVNRTGITFFALDLIPKRVELMKELVPGMKRVAIVGWPPHAGELLELEAAKGAADKLGLEHRYWGVGTSVEVDAALEDVRRWNAGAILVFAGAVSVSYPDRFAAFAAKNRVPACSSWADFAERGNLMCYGPVLQECYARLATFVDRILKGAKPADIPVERPTKFELVINLRAAKASGIPVPPNILQRADRVIE